MTSRSAAVRLRSRRTLTTRIWVLRALLVIGPLVAVEVLVRLNILSPLFVSPPSTALRNLGSMIPTALFWGDLVRTVSEILISFIIGGLLGALIGLACWRFQFLGRVLQPYLVGLFALPIIVFYPLMVAFMGIGPWPIVTIASLMTLIPVALNVMVALKSVPRSLHYLGRSFCCSTRQTYTKIIIPAATPLSMPGIKVGLVYAIVGVIAMEFILAGKGVGYRVGYSYRNYATTDMYSMIFVVAGLATLLVVLVSLVEHRVRRDML